MISAKDLVNEYDLELKGRINRFNLDAVGYEPGIDTEEFDLGLLHFVQINNKDSIITFASTNYLKIEDNGEVFDVEVILINNQESKNIFASIETVEVRPRKIAFTSSKMLDGYKPFFNAIKKLKKRNNLDKLLSNRIWRSGYKDNAKDHKFWERKVGEFSFYSFPERGYKGATMYRSPDLILDNEGSEERSYIYIEYYPVKKKYKAFITKITADPPSYYSTSLAPSSSSARIDVKSSEFLFQTKGYKSKNELLRMIKLLRNPVEPEELFSSGWEYFD